MQIIIIGLPLSLIIPRPIMPWTQKPMIISIDRLKEFFFDRELGKQSNK